MVGRFQANFRYCSKCAGWTVSNTIHQIRAADFRFSVNAADRRCWLTGNPIGFQQTVVQDRRFMRQSRIPGVQTGCPKADVGYRFTIVLATGCFAAIEPIQTCRLDNESNGLDVPPGATFSPCV